MGIEDGGGKRGAITFIASLPPIQSAITLDGMAEGGRIKLDVPRDYMREIGVLHGWSESPLLVTISPMTEADWIELQEAGQDTA